MAIFGHDAEQARRRIGHPSQLGGIKQYTLTDGRAAGMRAVDFRTTQGLEFTVLLDRAMDISEARYKGRSLCWRSPAGDVAPAYYNPKGIEWLRTFCGGLLATCGLTNVGPPTQEPDETGLHGRLGACPAEQVSFSEWWEGDSPLMQVSGVIREAVLFGPALEVRRTILARGDGAGLSVRDTITNIGARPAPCMLLYHINTGFPLLDDGTELILSAAKTEPRDAEAAEGIEDWARMHAPVTGYREKVYFHTLRAEAGGQASVAVVNRGLAGGLGLRLRFRTDELPCFTQWKMLGDKEYVLGIEPGNCFPMGREHERAAGRLVELAVGEQVSAGFELAVVEGEGLEALVREAGG
jgi:hypothetical protein